MATHVIWIDSLHAKVFKITTSGVQRKVIKLNAIQHSNGHHSGNLANSEENFFHDVAEHIGKAEGPLLVMGAGQAKNKFRKHLEKRHHRELLKTLVSVETLEELTDNQILSVSRRYFKKYNIFHFGY